MSENLRLAEEITHIAKRLLASPYELEDNSYDYLYGDSSDSRRDVADRLTDKGLGFIKRLESFKRKLVPLLKRARDAYFIMVGDDTNLKREINKYIREIENTNCANAYKLSLDELQSNPIDKRYSNSTLDFDAHLREHTVIEEFFLGGGYIDDFEKEFNAAISSGNAEEILETIDEGFYVFLDITAERDIAPFERILKGYLPPIDPQFDDADNPSDIEDYLEFY